MQCCYTGVWDETPGGKRKKKTKQNKIPNANASLCGSFQRDKGGRTTRQTQAGSVFVRENVHVLSLRLRPPRPIYFASAGVEEGAVFPTPPSLSRGGGTGEGESAEVPGEARCHTSRFWLIDTD